MSNSKCLAILYLLTTRPTRKPMLSWPVSLPSFTRWPISVSLASVAVSSSMRLCARSLASASLRHATSRSPGYSGELNSTRLRVSNSPSWSCPCSTRARMEALLSAVIQPTPSSWRISSMAFCEIMPRSPTITTCETPKSSRTRCTAGMNVLLSAVLPSKTDTATGQPRASVSSP